MKQKIWNNEYVDLAVLFKQIFSPNIDCTDMQIPASSYRYADTCIKCKIDHLAWKR